MSAIWIVVCFPGRVEAGILCRMKRTRVFLTRLGRRTVNFPNSTPPMGILMLAAYLRTKLDVDLRLMDQRGENASVESVVRQAVDFGADVVGLSVMTPLRVLAGAAHAGSAGGAARGVHCAGRVSCFCLCGFPGRGAGGQHRRCRCFGRGRMRARTGYPCVSGRGGVSRAFPGCSGETARESLP